jgi:hypothetical protein
MAQPRRGCAPQRKRFASWLACSAAARRILLGRSPAPRCSALQQNDRDHRQRERDGHEQNKCEAGFVAGRAGRVGRLLRWLCTICKLSGVCVRHGCLLILRALPIGGGSTTRWCKEPAKERPRAAAFAPRAAPGGGVETAALAALAARVAVAAVAPPAPKKTAFAVCRRAGPDTQAPPVRADQTARPARMAETAS